MTRVPRIKQPTPVVGSEDDLEAINIKFVIAMSNYIYCLDKVSRENFMGIVCTMVEDMDQFDVRSEPEISYNYKKGIFTITFHGEGHEGRYSYSEKLGEDD